MYKDIGGLGVPKSRHPLLGIVVFRSEHIHLDWGFPFMEQLLQPGAALAVVTLNEVPALAICRALLVIPIVAQAAWARICLLSTWALRLTLQARS